MKKIFTVILCFIVCGCSKVSFNNKEFLYNNNYSTYKYSFISDSIVIYKYKDNSYKCKYSIENNIMIKVVCKNDIKLLLYDKDNKCLYDHNSRVFCVK